MTALFLRYSSIGPTRKRVCKAATALLTAGLLLSQAGCSTNTTLQQASTSSSESTGTIGYQQLDKGLTQTFVYCQRCLQPTRKVLWTPEPSTSGTTTTGEVQPHDLPPVPTANAAPKPTTEVITNTSVHFKSNSSALSAEAQDELRQFCDQPMELDGITVTGFTDATGTKTRNQQLAHQRAQQTSLFLKRCTPKSAGLSVPVHEVGKGNCCYVDTNATPQGRQRNRRAEVSAELKSADITSDQRQAVERKATSTQETNQSDSTVHVHAVNTGSGDTSTASHD